MITEDYVSPETAKLLKEKGFDIPVYHAIRRIYKDGRPDTLICTFDRPENENDIPENENTFGSYSCPTLQMAMKWLREVHKLHIVIWQVFGDAPSEAPYRFAVEFIERKVHHPYLDFAFETYEQAADKAIGFCLSSLID